jgi:hypothetical protein
MCKNERLPTYNKGKKTKKFSAYIKNIGLMIKRRLSSKKNIFHLNLP